MSAIATTASINTARRSGSACAGLARLSPNPVKGGDGSARVPRAVDPGAGEAAGEGAGLGAAGVGDGVEQGAGLDVAGAAGGVGHGAGLGVVVGTPGGTTPASRFPPAAGAGAWTPPVPNTP